jgi:hypothetical protein
VAAKVAVNIASALTVVIARGRIPLWRFAPAAALIFNMMLPLGECGLKDQLDVGNETLSQFGNR